MTILEEAQKLVDDDRQKQYDSPKACLGKTAVMFAIATGHNLTDRDIAILNVCQKLARLSAGYKRDTVVDICGYLYIYADKIGMDK